MGGKRKGRRHVPELDGSQWWPPTPLSEPRPGLPGTTPATEPAADPGAPPATTPPTSRVVIHLEPRQRRLIDVALVLAVLALVFLVADDLAATLAQVGDLVLTFFLAWLVAFVLGPAIDALARPRGTARSHRRFGLPRPIAVAITYLLLLAVVGSLIVALAAALAQSLGDLVEQLPAIQARLPELVAPIEAQIRELGFRVDLVREIDNVIVRIGSSAAELVGPLQSVAVASLGALGTTLMVVILSIYISLDAPAIRTFVRRLIPPGHQDEWASFERSVGSAFGGFLRGQAVMGILYGLLAAGVSLALGLDFAVATSVASGVLQAIPFFGPFISWTPPVLVAVFTRPDALLPALVAMLVGWFVVMNIVQPRLMKATVGLHPIVVLASVLIGSEVAGVSGAIFGIPVAAVISAMATYYFRIWGEGETVAERAAARLEERVGAPVRVPREPVPGEDEDVAGA